MLTGPSRRPPVPRRALIQEVQGAQPADLFILDPLKFLICLRKARRGAAAGPSGMTFDHLFLVMENEGDSQRLVEVASLFAAGRVPEEIVEALRLGRIDELGVTQHITRGGRGARRSPHAHAFIEAQARLFGDEKLCAFLDDIYITSLPGRATEAQELWTHAGIHLHLGVV